MNRLEPVDAAAAPLSLPPHPADQAAPGFPVLAVIAPVAGAVVLWMVTNSMISLAFAALGPLIAVASVFDARRQARRARRRGDAERSIRFDAVRALVADRHALLRSAAWRRTPSARGLAQTSGGPGWHDDAPGSVVIGRGAVPSGLRVDGTPVDDDDRQLLQAAARLDDAPVLADVHSGIGVVGTLPLARAVARAIVVQLAHRCRPDAVEFVLPGGAAWSWARALPHHGAGSLRVTEAHSGSGWGEDGRSHGTARPHRSDAAGATIAVAASLSRLPPGLGTILLLENHERAVVDRRGGDQVSVAVVPELLGASEASLCAARLHAAASRVGIAGATALPGLVELDALEQPVVPPGSRAELRVAVGMRHGGVLELDLVTGGPHAIVAGTTGSGKSEFLLAWLTALAARHPPSRVAFLLVDFKGGAAFEPIAGLPHVTGVVTDLDEAQAERAVLSLRAELRHRERVLRTERARDIVELGPRVELARLVIVIDEFQAMIERFPDLGVVIADIAARGRSLGVHLVLASQRPNGVVREQVTANCAIRVSLRVMQRADSIAVVGTDAAASISAEAPGRGIVDAGDGVPIPFQSARADARSLAVLHDTCVDVTPARRPWVDPLPRALASTALDRAAASAGLEPGSLALGLVDEPDLQRHGVLAWSAFDGHLLVAGAPGSGRTTVLAAIAGAAARQQPELDVVRLDGAPSRQWDTLRSMQLRVARPGRPAILLIDDLDVRFRDWPDDHRQAAMDTLDAILREGRRSGVAVAATIGQAPRLGPGIREGFGELLLLRHRSRTDLMQAGGSGALWSDQDPPGSGQWHGHRAQLVDARPLVAADHPPTPALDLGRVGLCAVVSASPRADVAALQAAGYAALLLEPADTAVRAELARRAAQTDPADGSERCIVVGDADAWAANWAVANLVREEATVVVHGGPREYRVLAGGHGLPPLLDDPATQCWVRQPGAATERRAWPPGRATD